MAVYKTDRAVIEYEPKDKGTLADINKVRATQDLEVLTLFPCRPPIPVLISAASTSFTRAFSEALMKIHENKPTKLAVLSNV